MKKIVSVRDDNILQGILEFLETNKTTSRPEREEISAKIYNVFNDIVLYFPEVAEYIQSYGEKINYDMLQKLCTSLLSKINDIIYESQEPERKKARDNLKENIKVQMKKINNDS